MMMSGNVCLGECLSTCESFEVGRPLQKAHIHVPSVMTSLVSGAAGEFPRDFDQVFFWGKGVAFQTPQRG
jgi:hypothetical protein